MKTLRFDDTDFESALPPPGPYPCCITAARFRTSQAGNRMLVVTFALDGVSAGQDQVTEYLVLDGPGARGVAWSRRRLVQLYRLCGLEPRQGDPIHPSDMCGKHLMVEVQHSEWRGVARLRVVAYHPLKASTTFWPCASPSRWIQCDYLEVCDEGTYRQDW